jgi:hypothetical protein
MRAHSHSSSLSLDVNSPGAVEFFVGSAVITGWFLASAVIVAWLTAATWLMTSLSHAAAPLTKMETTVSQTAFKGDRLDSVRRSAGRTLVVTTTADFNKHSHAPIGCETAFSKLVHASFSVRCVT